MKKEETKQTLKMIVIVMMILGFVTGAIGFAISIDAILQGGPLMEILTGDGRQSEAAIGKILMTSSGVLLFLAVVPATWYSILRRKD